jgi:hypothetical protein
MVSEPNRPLSNSDYVKDFKPYNSILAFSSAPNRHPSLPLRSHSRPPDCPEIPPWRQALASPFFSLDSAFARIYGEDISYDESDYYSNVVERTFQHFCQLDKPGQSMEISSKNDEPKGIKLWNREAWIEVNDLEAGKDWRIEDTPAWGWIAGETEVTYDKTSAATDITSSTRHQYVLASFSLSRLMRGVGGTCVGTASLRDILSDHAPSLAIKFSSASPGMHSTKHKTPLPKPILPFYTNTRIPLLNDNEDWLLWIGLCRAGK